MQHLLLLPGDWFVWRWICVRSSGFPIDEPLALAGSRELVSTLDEVAGLDTHVDALASALITECRAARDASPGEQRSAWTKILKALDRRAALTLPADAPEAVHTQAAALAAQLARRDACAADLARLYTEYVHTAGGALRRWAADPRFREALLIQNPEALKTGAMPLLGYPIGASNYKTRRSEHLVANYLQRYATKNDTISFFGPLGWGELVTEPTPVTFTCRDPLLRHREMFLEHWMIDALAEAYSASPDLRRLLAPRLSPTVRLDGEALVMPVDERVPLSTAAAAVLRLCDGLRAAEAIAAAARAIPALEFSDDAEVFELLEDLVGQHIVIWRLELPTVGRHFERVLRQKLDALPDGAAKAEALARFATIETAFVELQRSTGDAERMAAAVDALAATFVEQTAKTATRKGGAIYAARTLYYEDCVRNIDVAIGTPIGDALGPPLALLAYSARWCTYEIARRYHQAFTETYQQLVGEDGGEVPYLRFWSEVSSQFPQQLKQRSAIVEAVGAELEAIWADLLGIDFAASACQRSSEALRARVLERFAAPHPGWPSARYHSPDVMIAAPSVEAVSRGEGLLVLGEFHPSINNLCLPFVLHQHPAAEELVRARELDIPQVCVAPVTSRQNTTRSDHNWTSTHHIDLELGDTPSWRPRDQVVAVAELVVDRGPDGLEVRTRDRRHAFDLITFFEYQIIAAGMTQFAVVPARPHVPRVTIDRLIVARESWRFRREEVPAIAVEDRLERLRAIHAWRHAHRLPRFVFFRASQEWKPCFLDFESPTYVDIFAQLARGAEYVTLSEMLPDIDHAWLADTDGRRYASELRMVMVDPEPFRPLA
jgi:Lantibiotic dehydratase, N terminus